MSDTDPIMLRSVRTQIDIRSKFFKIVLSVALCWLVLASVLAWGKYDQERQEGIPSSRQARTWLCEDNPFVGRPQSQTEVQDCFRREAEREDRWREVHDRWAKEAAIKWYILRGLVLPAAILVLAALRTVLAAAAMSIWKAYCSWLNSDTTASNK